MKKIGSRIIITGLAALVVIGCSETKPFASQFESNWKNADPKALSEAEPEPTAKIMPQTHFAAGKMFEAQGALGKATVQYQKALEMDPEHLGALNRLGMLYARTGRFAESENTLKRAVRLAPQSAQVRNNLGFGYLLAKRWADAEAEFQNALAIMPEFERARINLGIAYCRQQRFDEALMAFRQVVPEADAFYNLGLMFRSEQRFQDAGRAFKRAVRMNPSFLAAKQQLAQIGPRLRRQNDNELAMSEGQWQALVNAHPAPANDLERALQGYAETPPQSYDPQPQPVATQQYAGQQPMTKSPPAQTASANRSGFNQQAPTQSQPQASPRQQITRPIAQNQASADSPQVSAAPRTNVQTQPAKNQPNTMAEMQPMTPADNTPVVVQSTQQKTQSKQVQRQERQRPVAKQAPSQHRPVANSMRPVNEQQNVPAEVRNYQADRRKAKLANSSETPPGPVQNISPMSSEPAPIQSSRRTGAAGTESGARPNAAPSQVNQSRDRVAAKRNTRASSASAATTSAQPMDIVSDMTPITQPQPSAQTASHQVIRNQNHDQTSPSNPATAPAPQSNTQPSANAAPMTPMEPMTVTRQNSSTSRPQYNVNARKARPVAHQAKQKTSDSQMAPMSAMTPVQGDAKNETPTKSKSKAKKQDAKSSDEAKEMESMETVND